MTAVRPTVALVAAPGTARRAVGLLAVLGRWADVVSWQRRGDRRVDAIVATTVEAARTALDAPALGAGTPGPQVAVWVRDADEVAAARRLGASCLLAARPDLVELGALLVPPVGIEVDRWPWVAPVVRARMREARGLPALHVVRPEPGMEVDPGDELADELASCSVAVVGGPATLVALALGAPVVTSADTAQRLGLRPGRDVEVAASPEAALAVARALALDEGRAALLSRRGRRCAEHHLDLGRPVRRLADCLAIVAPTTDPGGRMAARLDELATPPGAAVRARVEVALAGLGGDGGGSQP